MSAKTSTALNVLALDTASGEPLYVQIYDQVRELILTGRLGAGTRLPSTRALASELGVSRTTTLSAYDQLASEGYIDGQLGSGAYVSAELPDELLGVAGASGGDVAVSEPPATVSAFMPRPFDSGMPDTRGFPFAEWSRHLARSWRNPTPDMLHIANTSGDPALRAAIARHVNAVRGIECAPEQVIVTSGAAGSIELLSRALFKAGDKILIEDPCYPTAFGALTHAGLEPLSVPVDSEGLKFDATDAGSTTARAALVTPSRQYPLGMTLSVSRRLELLSWAGREGAWIIEDDYDSEYRYSGRPLQAMMSLDRDGRVIYLGSFSKIMFRSLRLGYIIVPRSLISRLHETLTRHPSQASLVPQAALAVFMESGDFAQHVRRTRRLYAERCELLHRLITTRMPHLLNAPRNDAGMHMTVYFRPALTARLADTEAATRADAAGLTVSALSVHYRRAAARNGLLLGFAGFDVQELTDATERLQRVLEATPPSVSP
jgi:GntR family transcriptional regulator/MocR family aminotransferase